MRSLPVILSAVLISIGCQQEPPAPQPFWSYAENWMFEDSSLWSMSGDSLELQQAGAIPADIRRPGSVAVVSGTDNLGTFHMRGQVRSTQDTTVVGRDVIVVFGYQSPRQFYYAHLSNDNTIMAHNGIFVVDHADRKRIDIPGMASPPETRLNDSRWHDIRIDRNVDSGMIRVFVDNLREPLMTATDTTFRSGAIGFGSFDDTGGIRNLKWIDGPGPLLDPVSEHPGEPRFSIRLEPFAVIPASDTTGGPMARINYLTHAGDGSGRKFVPDLRGTLYVIRAGDVLPFLNVAEAFPDFVDSPGLGSGFGFVAFHPEFGSNGLFYTVHTEAGRALTERRPDYSSGDDVIQGVITEWTAVDPAADVFNGSRRQVMRIGFNAVLHGIQQIGFNPLSGPADADYGLLYVAVGDGEAPGRHSNAPQSLSVPNGKILRFNTTGSDSPNGGYGIPEVNPFAGQKGALGEIWAMGLRNPHRFSWDPATGQMLISHIGEAHVDAIFQGLEGANYGWNEREGGFRYEKEDPLEVYPVLEHRPEFTPPVIRLDHDEINALVGGFVYRGRNHEALEGAYLFADLASGKLFEASTNELAPGRVEARVHRVQVLDEHGSETTMAELTHRSRAEVRFGQDEEGRIYILSKANGAIWRISDVDWMNRTSGR